jgi:hypothetical protein
MGEVKSKEEHDGMYVGEGGLEENVSMETHLKAVQPVPVASATEAIDRPQVEHQVLQSITTREPGLDSGARAYSQQSLKIQGSRWLAGGTGR